ncbi:hypothetical protein [Streptomyces niveus]|uniref:hypothetical protein n=1 Tax=Streptomyces niveus TaxID=193462 RepID=UPI00365F3FF4
MKCPPWIACGLVAEVRSKPKPTLIRRRPGARLPPNHQQAPPGPFTTTHPDGEVDAIKLFLKQMEHFANEWSTSGVPED